MAQAWNLYTSHTLSTWNARTYEFAAVSTTFCDSYKSLTYISLDSLYRLCLPKYPPCLIHSVKLTYPNPST